MHEPDTVADDRLTGDDEIAAFLGTPRRRTRHLIDKKIIPVGREGDRVVASKRRLREYWRDLTGAEPLAEQPARRRAEGVAR